MSAEGHFTDSREVEIAERYGEAFARAFAVFVRELAAVEAGEDVPAAGRPDAAGALWANSEDEDDAGFAEELDAAVKSHRAMAESGMLEVLDVSGDEGASAVAVRLRAIMNERGMTQKRLADRMGVSPARISRALKDPTRLKVDTLRRIAEALDIRVRDVL